MVMPRPNPPPRSSPRPNPNPAQRSPLKPRRNPPPPLQRNFSTFTWRGHAINYRVEGPSHAPSVLLVHGFGASVQHWRRNIPALAGTSRVYAIDLLGFGASAKPGNVEYGIELWAELLVDFCTHMEGGRKWSFVGNSIGSLTCLAAARQLGREKVAKVALVNCAGGLVSFRYDEVNFVQRVLLRLFNAVLFNGVVGPVLFERFRSRENVRGVLKQVYLRGEAVTDELVEIICRPAEDEGAVDVFLKVLNGDPGPRPDELLGELGWCPMLVVWGEDDPWTPLRGGFHPGDRFGFYHDGVELKVVPGGGALCS